MANERSHSPASSGMLTFWTNCKISTKIFAGFSVLLVLIAIISVMAYRAFGEVDGLFDAYRQRVQVVGIIRDLDREFVNLRRFVREFAFSASDQAAAGLEKQRGLIKDLVAKGAATIKDPERHRKTMEAGGQIDAYFAMMDKVLIAKREQMRLTQEVLDPSGRKMREELEALLAEAQKIGEPNAIALAGMAMEQAMLARLNVSKLLGRHEKSAGDDAEKALGAFSKIAVQMEAAFAGGESAKLVADVKVLLDKYRQAFRRADELVQTLEKLVFADMPKIADDTMADLASIKASAIADEHKLENQATATVSAIETMIAGLAAGALALGALLAFLIGNAIGKPVREIGAVLLQLAGGNKNVTIPYADRGDEVGDNARAARTFKENLQQLERLEDERKAAERAAQEQRRADMLKLADSFQAAVGEIISTLSSASSQLEASAQGLTHTAGHTQELSTTVAAASEEASCNVQSVASATEQLSGSVDEISRQVNESSRIASEAVLQAQQTDERMNELSQAATRIGDVIKLITDIAEQTNLLALNATIEAARAGEAGKGFAVVAQEVKTLAAQTAKATDEVGSQIGGIQAATRDSVAAIKQIDATIHRISEIASSVAEAAAEQGAATQEIARNVHQAAQGTHQVAASISEVSKGASETGSASAEVLTAAKSMAAESNRLKMEVDKFLAGVRAA